MLQYGRTWNRPLTTVQGQKPVAGTGMTAIYSYDVTKKDLTVSIHDPDSRTVQSQLPQNATATSVTSISRERSFTLTFKAQEIVLDGVSLPKKTEVNENNGVHFEAYDDAGTTIVRGWLLPLKSKAPEVLYAVAKIEQPFGKDEPRPMLLAEASGEDDTANCVDAVVVVIPPP